MEREQLACHLTRTTPETHRLIQENLHETPVYGGWVDSKGPRYCPSIEDKIVRFKDKDSHQVGQSTKTHLLRLTVRLEVHPNSEAGRAESGNFQVCVHE